MNIFEQGRQLLNMDGLFPERIDYLRDGLIIAKGVPAKVGRKLFRLFAENGSAIYVHARRFIVREDDMGRQSPPRFNDAIVWNGRRYKVSNPDGGSPWEEHLPGQIAVIATDAGEM